MAENFLVNARQFKFEMVAPEKVEVSAHEERVLLPGEDGDFMVLGGHTQLLAGLRPGVVSVFHTNNVVRYFITGGFADVGNQHCTVLTPHVLPVTKLVVEALAREIEQVETKLAATQDSAEQEVLNVSLEILLAKLDAAEKYNA